MKPVLYIVIPCYNEAEVLPVTAPLFCDKLNSIAQKGYIDAQKSKVLFVNDGSKDKTWDIICDLSKSNKSCVGISLSRNRGHQNALLAGLMYAKDRCDITVSVDCDGQDDINAIDEMVKEYLNGSQIVYGVRSDRRSDGFFKRSSAHLFYKLLNVLGAETIYNHADYRLMSTKALNELSKFKEVNIYLRGMVPLVGFKSSCVYYERHERVAGKTHYPLKMMLKLAFDGITSLSVRPIHLITALGFVIALISLVFIVWSVVIALRGESVAGWASIVSIVSLLGGIQLICLGVIGEYIGKIYLETKGRPTYIISDTTEKNSDFS